MCGPLGGIEVSSEGREAFRSPWFTSVTAPAAHTPAISGSDFVRAKEQGLWGLSCQKIRRIRPGMQRGWGEAERMEVVLLLMDSSSPPAVEWLQSTLPCTCVKNAAQCMVQSIRNRDLRTEPCVFFSAAAFISDATRLPCKGIQLRFPAQSRLP